MTPEEMKERRKELKLTQAEVANRIGITLRHYSRIELGISPLTNVMKKVVKMELES